MWDTMLCNIDVILNLNNINWLLRTREFPKGRKRSPKLRNTGSGYKLTSQGFRPSILFCLFSGHTTKV